MSDVGSSLWQVATYRRLAFIPLAVAIGWLGSDYVGPGIPWSANQFELMTEIVGRPFPYVSRVSVPADLRQGEWVVVFYNVSCPKCHALLAELEGDRGLALAASRRRFAVVSVFLETSENPLSGETDTPPFIVYGTMKANGAWEIPTPMVVLLQNGIVRAVGDDLTSLDKVTPSENLVAL